MSQTWSHQILIDLLNLYKLPSTGGYQLQKLFKILLFFLIFLTIVSICSDVRVIVKVTSDPLNNTTDETQTIRLTRLKQYDWQRLKQYDWQRLKQYDWRNSNNTTDRDSNNTTDRDSNNMTDRDSNNTTDRDSNNMTDRDSNNMTSETQTIRLTRLKQYDWRHSNNTTDVCELFHTKYIKMESQSYCRLT